MSPLQIIMLLQYYALANDYRDEVEPGHAHSPAVKETLGYFFREDLIEQVCDDIEFARSSLRPRRSQYRVTDKGIALVNALCAVKIPICKWVQP